MGAFSLLHILILLVIAGLFIGVPVLIVLLCVSSNRKKEGTGERDANNPNLTPCPDCRKYVSRLAANCPNCGRPLKS